MLERRRLTDDLNVGVGERLRALLALGSVLALLFWAAGLAALWLPVAALAASALANLQLIRYFKARRGALFASCAFLYHQLYYLYSSAAFGYASLQHFFKRFEERRSARRLIRNRGG
jgi:hypothetical protein